MFWGGWGVIQYLTQISEFLLRRLKKLKTVSLGNILRCRNTLTIIVTFSGYRIPGHVQRQEAVQFTSLLMGPKEHQVFNVRVEGENQVSICCFAPSPSLSPLPKLASVVSKIWCHGRYRSVHGAELTSTETIRLIRDGEKEGERVWR